MTDMIEKVARAICVCGGDDPDETGKDVHGVPIVAWEMWGEEARAALLAIREPTEKMVHAGSFEIMEHNGNHYCPDPETMRLAFQAMISDALKAEGPPPMIDTALKTEEKPPLPPSHQI